MNKKQIVIVIIFYKLYIYLLKKTICMGIVNLLMGIQLKYCKYTIYYKL